MISITLTSYSCTEHVKLPIKDLKSLDCDIEPPEGDDEIFGCVDLSAH